MEDRRSGNEWNELRQTGDVRSTNNAQDGDAA